MPSDTPWDRYWDALQTLQWAERTGDADGIAQAKREAEDARLECGLLGGFLMTCALKVDMEVRPHGWFGNEKAGPVERLLQQMFMKSFGEIATLASQEAVTAHATARVLLFEIEALKNRVKQLEARLVKYECPEPLPEMCQCHLSQTG